MNLPIKNKLTIIIPIIIMLWALNRFLNSSVFDTMISDGNEEIKEFVKKSFSWGIFFGALIAVLIKYIAQLLNNNNQSK
ncbi:hypothetical protein [Chryseobacterium oryzae]|uniref:Uncharacterized protein n=1 Tax=Chryseobacterium oryzae TaxID=2929799 RepID=A0ABY4BK86_9FLAO|nr:hypothetical protein [Chryseobacterium oryzae]UOE38131.1 hypothetical protein MTP08_13920 [Chryseobacterium oryzae]